MSNRNILNRAGIYKITNKITNKFYLGSTINIRKRWKHHRNSLRKNKHCNKYLQSSYNKHGAENFLYEVVEFVEMNDLTEIGNILLEIEQKYLNELKPWDHNIGYNISKKTSSIVRGIKHSDLSRKHMSESHMGHKHTDESKRKISESQFKTVYQVDKNGNLIATFSSCLEVEQKLKIKKQLISMCCRSKIKSTGGYHWTYDITNFIKPTENRKKIKRPWKARKVTNYQKTWESLSDASVELNLTISQIRYRIQKKEFSYAI